MPTQTETSVAKLKINRLTQSQFDGATTQTNELYLVDPEFTGGKLLETDSNGDIVESDVSKDSLQGALASTTVTLTTSGWSSSTQTVSVTGMTATKVVWVSPSGSSMSDYADAGVYCSAQGSGTLTFTCSTTPSSNLTVQVVFG